MDISEVLRRPDVLQELLDVVKGGSMSNALANTTSIARSISTPLAIAGSGQLGWQIGRALGNSPLITNPDTTYDQEWQKFITRELQKPTITNFPREQQVVPVTRFPTIDTRIPQEGIRPQQQEGFRGTQLIPPQFKIPALQEVSIEDALGKQGLPEKWSKEQLMGYLNGKISKGEYARLPQMDDVVYKSELLKGLGGKPEEQLEEVVKGAGFVPLSPQDEIRLKELENMNAKTPLGAIEDIETGSWDELLTLQNRRDKLSIEQLYAKQKAIERQAQQAQARGDKKLAKKLWNESNHYNARAENIGINPDKSLGEQTKFSQYQLPGGENYREIVISAPGERVFTSSHFPDEKNPIAHIRANDRTTPDGKKVLFIEELQSDWARKARETNFAGRKPLPEGWKVENHPETKHAEWQIKDENGYLQYQGNTEANMWQHYESNKNNVGAPSHPLLKNWQELALKRALKEAVDKGYDYISWTTGEQQAERYDLSKQVKKIDYEKIDDKYHIIVYPKNVDAGRNRPEGMTLSEKELATTIGKDAAEKVIKTAGKDTQSLSNLDLKIGGEWAKNLYDRQVPNILKDLTKGQIEEISLGGKVPTTKIGRLSSDELATYKKDGQLKQMAIRISKLSTPKEQKGK